MSLEQTLLENSQVEHQTGPATTPDILAHIESKDAEYFQNISYEDLRNYTGMYDPPSPAGGMNFGAQESPFNTTLNPPTPARPNRGIVFSRLIQSFSQSPYLLDDSFFFV